MSKCEISIEFDRVDRTYRGGDTVSGAVRIRVNEDLQCNGIKLSHFWKTHGRGNTDTGEKRELLLVESGPLRDGETLEFPFSFAAEYQPVTYHGHYINIDHYVRVDVDVPWARDPKSEEEYIVLPGIRPPQMTSRRDEVIDFKKQPGEIASGAGKFVVFLILGAVLILVGVFAMVLVPLLIVGGAVAYAVKKMIEGRVGNVAVKAGHVVVAPGEAWPLEIGFTPRKGFAINGITVKVQGQEAATSGSGTNKTTHRHTVFEEVHVLHPAGRLPGGEPILKQVQLDLPKTDAFSFDGGSNKIEWSAEVRIDMPLFPDWKERRVLQFVPAEFLQDAEAIPVPAHERQPAPSTPSAVPGPLQPSERWQDAAESAGERLSVEQPTEPFNDAGPPRTDIVPLLTELAEAGQYGQERRELATAAKGRVFDVAVAIDQIMSTFGSPAGAGYHNGKTITGTVDGTEHTVQVFTRDSSNPHVERLSRGAHWHTQAAVHGWDSLYNRLVLVEVDDANG